MASILWKWEARPCVKGHAAGGWGRGCRRSLSGEQEGCRPRRLGALDVS